MAQLVKRVVLTGVETAVTFTGYSGSRFLVKNFSNSDVYASFESPLVEDESFKISSGMYQIVFNNENLNQGLARSEEYSTIYLKGTGEVEVDVLCFREL